MKIMHFSNSFISVEVDGQRLVCDPWLGKANMGGWQSFPEFSVPALTQHLKGTLWVYISHLHDDHFDIKTLEALGLIGCEFIIKRFATSTLRERLQRLGVAVVHEVDPFTVQRFGALELVIFPQALCRFVWNLTSHTMPCDAR